MDPYLGTFAKGDNTHVARLAPRTDAGVPWGTATASGGMGTGWTAELLIYRAGTTTLLAAVSGTPETADEFAYLFSLGDQSVLWPTGVSVDYDALLRLKKVANVFVSGPNGDARNPYRFTILDTEP